MNEYLIHKSRVIAVAWSPRVFKRESRKPKGRDPDRRSFPVPDYAWAKTGTARLGANSRSRMRCCSAIRDAHLSLSIWSKGLFCDGRRKVSRFKRRVCRGSTKRIAAIFHNWLYLREDSNYSIDIVFTRFPRSGRSGVDFHSSFGLVSFAIRCIKVRRFLVVLGTTNVRVCWKHFSRYAARLVTYVLYTYIDKLLSQTVLRISVTSRRFIYSQLKTFR